MGHTETKSHRDAQGHLAVAAEGGLVARLHDLERGGFVVARDVKDAEMCLFGVCDMRAVAVRARRQRPTLQCTTHARIDIHHSRHTSLTLHTRESPAVFALDEPS